ncbi:hypothetical protein [Amycolatopsis sp. GM8]|uniref:hypothetical protein n=1 Tax=Amycolatopsis sp. GM8 TaxID=2896530 RepID=UPI001F1A3773|nr:hypothetical protein [Amycolatopsis sp. GM8]
MTTTDELPADDGPTRQEIERERARARRLLKRLESLRNTCERVSSQARMFECTHPGQLDLSEEGQLELRHRLNWAEEAAHDAVRVLKVHLFDLSELESAPEEPKENDQ